MKNTIQLKEIHPYQNNEKLVLHYAEDEQGKKYKIIQIETGIKFDEAIDLFLCQYTYQITNELIETDFEQDTEIEGEQEINELENEKPNKPQMIIT